MTSPMSTGFDQFVHDLPRTAQAHMAFVKEKADESALDGKTNHLAYLAVLAATGLTSGIPFHVGLARQAGASREEVLSATLVGLQAVGLIVIDAYAVARTALDQVDNE
ncbi:MAG: carboxymuconolactone decarboxylase family protein [Propionibacteriaceae bacterium]|nr:carboxymuconolactone decarboxylase family protein [Propionibacteriaceae bacterium]